MKIFLGLLAFLSGLALHAQQRMVLDSDRSSIEYFAKHPAHKWSGTNKAPQGIIEFVDSTPKRIAVKANLSGFDSKNANRDSNSLRVLKALDYPEVRFYSERISLNNMGKAELLGYFELAGVQSPASVELDYINEDEFFKLEGTHNVDLLAFEVDLPRFLFKAIDSEIELKLSLFFVK
ncbi:MAG: YceI family protein [Bacteroidetes bacterium]|nr:YceI family protein [Bacteroidota bacterium]